jgi:hypothetical protein
VKTNHCMRHANFCGGINEWYTKWPHLMKLWQNIFVMSFSIAICERGLSKQNAIKSHLQASLKLDMWGRVGGYGLEGNISIVAQHEESENS